MKKLLILSLLLLSLSSYSQKITSTNSIGGNLTLGNTESITFTVSSSTQCDREKSNWSVSPYFCYNETKNNGVITPKQREYYLTSSFDEVFGKWKLYVITDNEISLQKKFNYRISDGIGIGRSIIDNKWIKASSSIALMPEIYQTTSKIDANSVRASLRVKFESKGFVRFSTITIIQPSFFNRSGISSSDNFNMRSTNSIIYPITDKLSFTAQILINTSTLSSYLNKSVLPTDINSTLSLSYKF